MTDGAPNVRDRSTEATKRSARPGWVINSMEKTALSALAERSKLVPSGVLTTVPVDLEKLGSYWGVQKIVKRKLDVAGLLYRLDSNRSIVFVKDDDLPSRQRFSCAHEFGHIIVAGNGSPQVSCRTRDKVDRALERSCDVIATEILMPRQLFCSAADQYGWTLRAVRELAHHFQVSFSAAAIRLLELTKEPLLMSAWRADSTPLLTLKLRWSRPNDLAKTLRPDVRWKTGPDALPTIYQAFEATSFKSGSSRVLVKSKGESIYRTVLAEALGIGSGRERTVFGFHYLLRNA